MLFKLLIPIFLIASIVTCCGVIYNTYKVCKKNKFGDGYDGYFMIFTCALPALFIIGTSVFLLLFIIET